MGFTWHEPRKRTQSDEPRIVIGTKMISMNPACTDKYFKDSVYDHAKIGYDIKSKKMIIIPVTKEDKYGLKVIANQKWSHRYLNAKNIISKLPIKQGERGEFSCSWDDQHKGILIDLEKDRIE